jgi:formylmethanofuran dehydrogenase subunit E
MIEKKACDLCGEKFPVTGLTKTDDGLLCGDCASIVDECSDCGCAIRDDDEKEYDEVTDELYCEECAKKRNR